MEQGNVLFNREKKSKLMVSVIVIFLVVVVSVVKYRSDEVNYLNSDATWHTLLTIEAYDETPISTHLFLPIVSLGNDEDKFIIWGATIPDKEGNYYYTSFSPAGYIAPWIFMKVFRLNACERSLYIFNSLLFLISAVLWSIFIFWIFEAEKDNMWISIIGAATYVLTPELLHGMGIVYWHQSLMQVTLLIQIMAFWKMKKSEIKSAKVIFYLFAFLNPYIEWTGYIANIGFSLAELMINHKKNLKKAFIRTLILGMITISSFLSFAGHYLLRVDRNIFFRALRDRFMARNVATPVAFTSLFGSYLSSFLFLWVLLFILLIWNVLKKQNIELKHGILMFILSFPIIENVVMKQHAIAYPYDKMKACFILSFLVCELTHQILLNSKNKKTAVLIASVCALITGVLNLRSYLHNELYTWTTTYRTENRQIAAYVNENYPESVLGIENKPIRGYMNLLFGRGIYEFISSDALKDIAVKKGKSYAILLDVVDPAVGEVYDLNGATVYDVHTGKTSKIMAYAGEIVVKTISIDGASVYQVSSLTDQNWTAGYSNTANILLFEYDTNLLIALLKGHNIVCEDNLYSIEDIDYDSQWIRVWVGTDASACKYPNYVQIE